MPALSPTGKIIIKNTSVKLRIVFLIVFINCLLIFSSALNMSYIFIIRLPIFEYNTIFPNWQFAFCQKNNLLHTIRKKEFFMLAPHFIQLLTSSRPAAIARIKPLVNTPFVFFFAVNTLRDTSGFFNMLLLIYGAGLPPLCQKPLFYFYFFLISGQPVQAHFFCHRK